LLSFSSPKELMFMPKTRGASCLFTMRVRKYFI
jgi:hypothetical protein